MPVGPGSQVLIRQPIDGRLGAMRLKPLSARLLIVAGLAGLPVAVVAQSPVQEERIAASFVLALGRTPTPDELQRWFTKDPVPLAEYLDRHRRQLRDDRAAERAVIDKASRDAFGRASTEEEATSLSGVGTYADLMRRHLQWLDGHRAEYERVMHRAYRLLLERDAYSVEVDYWTRQPVLSFALLVGCVEDWARRNRPGLMATTGVASVSVNSPYLATVRLSVGVAAEARAAVGLVQEGDSAQAAALGRTLVVPGAERVASVGGITFTAAGSPRLSFELGNQ
jgi:hypothetical protein